MKRSTFSLGIVFTAAMVIAACGGKRSTSNDDATFGRGASDTRIVE